MRLARLTAVLIGVSSLAACHTVQPGRDGLPGGTRVPVDPRYVVDGSGRIVQATVTVTATCVGNLVTFNLQPWEVPISPGGTIVWKVTSPGADDVEVYGKMPPRAGNRPWPFGPNPVRGKARGAVGIPPTTPGAQGSVGERSNYGIRFTCTDDGRTTTIDIDPDIIIVQDIPGFY